MKLHFNIAMCSAVMGVLALSSPVMAQQKTAKACQEEWRANKAANQATGKTEKAYVAECRGAVGKPAAETTPAAPARPTAPVPAPAAAAPKPAPAPAAAAPKQVPTPAATATRPAPTRTTPAAGSTAENQYTTEAEAKTRCSADTVVWVNLSSKVYHFAGHRTYGKTKNGAYMCEKDTAGAGARASKNEKHP